VEPKATARDPARVCAVIPALDEAAAIGAVVAGALGFTDEVIVVDNGSRDATAARARAAGGRVVSEPRRGYGRACLTGARAAPAEAVLVFSDGDGSDDPAALGRLAAAVVEGRADLVVGSRARRHQERGALAAHQRAGNWMFSTLIRRLWGIPITDLGPMRAIRREDLIGLDMRSVTYGWPVEMVVKAARCRLRVMEVPVAARRRAAGRSKVSGSLRASGLAGVHFAAALVRHGTGRPPCVSPARGDRASRSADVQRGVAPLGRGVGERQ
jgi:glycosyltransferase involved in cell wall biosynthesis